MYERILDIFRSFISYMAVNQSTTQVLALPIVRLKELLAYLERHNRAIKTDVQKKKGVIFIPERCGLFLHRNFQLPCTVETRRERAELISSLLQPNQAALLIGDDDLVSVELADLGLRNVTVVEIDSKVTSLIQELTVDAPFPPKVIETDIVTWNPNAHDPFQIIVTDPPYNIELLKSFCKSAIKISKSDLSSHIFLMINPYCFTRTQLNDVHELFLKEGYILAKQIFGFNSYPMTRFNAFILRLCYFLCFWKRFDPSVPLALTHYFSDCLVFADSNIESRKGN